MSLTRSESKDRHLAQKAATLGTTLALVAALCGGIISVTVGCSKAYISGPDLLFYRFSMATILLGFCARKSLHKLFSRDAFLVWAMGISGALSASCYYWTLQNLNVGTAMLLANTSLLFIVLFSWLFLKELLSAKSLFGVVVMFLAITLVNLDEINAPSLLELAIGTLGAIVLAVCSVCLRATANLHSAITIVFVFSLCTTAVSVALPGFSWQLPITSGAWVCVGVTLVAGFGANVFSTMAMKHLHAGIVGALTKTAICWALIFVYFKDGSVPSGYEFGAYSLTLMAVVLLQRIKIPRRSTCLVRSVKLDWDSSCFKSRAESELPKLIQVAEAMTSCEFKFHLDNSFQGDVKQETRRVFQELRLQKTELRNGVLIAFYKHRNQGAVYFDSGITTQISPRKLRQWAVELLGAIEGVDLVDELGPAIQSFARDLSLPFPIAIDDINELSDEVSLVWE